MLEKDEMLAYHSKVFKKWMKVKFGNIGASETADLFEVSRFTIMNYTKGSSFVSSDVLWAIKTKFPKVDLNELFDIEYDHIELKLLQESSSPYGIDNYNNLKRETELLKEQVVSLKDHINTLKSIIDN